MTEENKNIRVITKDQAMIKIINYLNSKMSVMSRSATDEVVKLAIVQNISALDLITKYQELVREI
jgi:hypothetical protein